uniref:Peptidase M60 domain-containing protein n=1 Tax=Leptobrachium leishanense TaxID=445787 RepID=A0A8C5MSS0_9ANUR
MTLNEDYQALVRGLSELDFVSDAVPCKLLLTGDSTFPVVVTKLKEAPIAASRYGKGRIVVLAHESYLTNSKLMGFLKNAVTWLSPNQGAAIGVHRNLDALGKSLSTSGYNVRATSGLEQGLGVLCINGFDGAQAKEIRAFVREGGGLLIGAQAWDWASKHKNENILQRFPGNKIISASGIYFTDKQGEKGVFRLTRYIRWTPIYTDVDLSQDLEQLLHGVSHFDISGSSVPSELLLHGALTFPIGLSDSNQCFLAAATYGRGRIVVGTHEGYLCKPELKTFFLNAISWLDRGKKGMVGVQQKLGNFAKLLENENIQCKTTDLVSGLHVYCCTSYSDSEAKKIHEFVAEGGGLLIAGHAWNWASGKSPKDVLSKYPGNKILNKFGISILEKTIRQGVYKAIDPQALSNSYHFPRAFCQLQRDLQNKVDIKPPLNDWLQKLRQDLSTYMNMPASPLVFTLQLKFGRLLQGNAMPNVSKQCPVKGNSKEALMLCLAQDVCSLSLQETETWENFPFHSSPPITVSFEGTNTGDGAWRSTGLYLQPGKSAALLFPSSVAGKGLQVQVGCHTDNLSSADKLCRAPVVVNKTGVREEKVLISCVWGGLLYIIVPAKSQLGSVSVTIYGAEPAPIYVKGFTGVPAWVQYYRNMPAPWAELITENIILTLPSSAIRSLDDPETLLHMWDNFMQAISDLAATPKKFNRPERIVADVQISVGWMHSGYPIMCHLESAKQLVDIEQIKKSGLWGAIHELGHNQQRGCWEFPPNTTEATCNLWSVYVHENILGIPRNRAHEALKPESREERIKTYLNKGADLGQWSVWTALETYLQLQECFGWDPFKSVFAEYQTMSGMSNDKKAKMNLWAVKFSQTVQRNLAPFFKAWGWPIDEQTCKTLSSLPEWENNPMKR